MKTEVARYIASQNSTSVSINLDNETVRYSGIKQFRVITELKPEEYVRAYLIAKLTTELGYEATRIEIEREYSAGRPRTMHPRIDLVVRDRDGNAFLFMELKSPEEYDECSKDEVIKEQLFKLAAMEEAEGRRVKYLVLHTARFNGEDIDDDCIIIDYAKHSLFDEWAESREATNTIPNDYGRARKEPYIKGSSKDLSTSFSVEMLHQLQVDLHNVLWGGGGTDDNEVFASLTNLILSKIQDEDEREDGELYQFQSMAYIRDGEEEFETNENLFERINALYRRAMMSKLYVTDPVRIDTSYVIDRNKFSLSKLKYAVQKLESLSFVDGKNSLDGKDILGEFFEGIVRTGFKQSAGQYFTHVNLVRFMLWGIQADRLAITRIREDQEIPYIIDPSAGSGTFLIEYMRFITKNMKVRFRNELGTSRAVKDKIESDWFYPDYRENKWAQKYIYGCEISFDLGTAAKVNMILHGDGSTNIFVKDGLLPFGEYVKEVAPNMLHDAEPDEEYGDKPINGQFDLILTNPPFNVDLDNDTKATLARSFAFCDKENSENLFIERWYQLLRENGRLAAVLPESVFDIEGNKYIRLFIYKYFVVKAIVSLPQLAFEPYTSTKTSILFARKKTREEVKAWNDAWKTASKIYGKLKTRAINICDVANGRKKQSSLPSISALNEEEQLEILKQFLGNRYKAEDGNLSRDEFVAKYEEAIMSLNQIDTDDAIGLGCVNAWRVFEMVTETIDYPIFMAEVDNVGYKRTRRGEKPAPNELYRQLGDGSIAVNDGVMETVLDYLREVDWEQ